jgi:hypothetical protein
MIREACLLPDNKTVLACAFAGETSCRIVLPGRDLAWRHGYRLPAIRRHEIGHCNGWKHK